LAFATGTSVVVRVFMVVPDSKMPPNGAVMGKISAFFTGVE